MYDVAIIGSGLGGLSCGVTLSREGLKVLVLEQARVAGGCLQSFRRDGHVIDTGIHYIGSLGEGQIARQHFKYLGILDRMNLVRMDKDGFDVMRFGDGREYMHAMGYANFIDTLASEFPSERRGIEEFCRTLQAVGGSIHPEVLRSGRLTSGAADYMSMPIWEEVCRCTGDERLRNVLTGSNLLYAGKRESASAYAHAMIAHSNIEGAHRIAGGSQMIADALVEQIRANGGEIRFNTKVTGIHTTNGLVDYITAGGERIECRKLISDIHPKTTFAMVEGESLLRKAFYSRVNSLEDSYGIHTTFLLLKPGTVEYINRNYYLFEGGDSWEAPALVSMQPVAGSACADVVSIMTPMPKESLQQWNDTRTGHRGKEYEEFKQSTDERLTSLVLGHFPQFRGKVEKVFSASPLTYRDWTGTPDGSAYGIVKDCRNPLANHLPVRSRIENLLLSGQNLNMHGVIGVLMSAAVTCGEIVGTEYIAKKIGNA